RLASRLIELCGETRTIEDLWLDVSVVSSNLTTSDIHVHRSGLLWRALQASTAIPGVFPPVVEPDGVLVDGGVVANLPLDLARRLHPGATLIASDVGRNLELSPDDFPPERATGGWRNIRSPLRRRRQASDNVRVLTQVTVLGGAGSSQEPADLHIELALDRFGMFDFRKGHDIIEAGYQQSVNQIDAVAHRLPYRFADVTSDGMTSAAGATP
ncbi:MAG: patatin-like phospholipase family protein, partial [Acidimicrobiales bacterium]